MRNTGPKYPLFARLLRTRSAGVLFALFLAAAFAAAFVPLFGTLGYESALLFGLAAAWIGAVLPIAALRRFRRIDAFAPARARLADWRDIPARWLHLTLAGWLLLLPPMAVLTANALRVPNCAMLEGALFWLLIPFMTTAFVAAVLLFLDALTGRRAVWIFYLLLALMLFQPFVQVLTRPQIFAYNHVFGMFLGLSWDQTQPPFLTLFLYRCSTLSYVALLLVAASALQLRSHASAITATASSATASAATASAITATASRVFSAGTRRAFLLAFLVPLGVAMYFHFHSDRLGFTSSYAHLRAELGAEFQLEGIRLVHDPGSFDSTQLRLVAEEHLFQLERVSAELGVEWEGGITSYIYPDRVTKRRLLGTESSDLARPWKREIHLSLDSWTETVKHELTHVVAGAFGPYAFRAPFVRVLGLTEGLAMAVEWSWGNRSLHEFSAGMMAQGLLPHARQCIGTAGFVTGNSSRGYVASGSLTRWLIDSLGIAPIRRAYAADDLETAVGMDYDEIDRRWRVFLGGVRRELPDSLAIAYAFRRPSLFSAVCPRVITERNRAAAEAVDAGRVGQGLALYRDAEALAPNARSAFGIVSALYALRQWDSVRTVTERYLADSTRAFSLFPMLLWHGAAAWRSGDSAAADRAFSLLIREGLPGWPGPFSERLRSVLRRGGTDSLGLLVTEELMRGSGKADSSRLAHLGALLCRHSSDPVVVGEYMRASINERDAGDAGRRRALRSFEGVEHLAVPYWQRMLAARLYYHDREFKRALRLLRHQLNKELTAAQRAAVTEWMARCAWQLRRAQR